MATVYNYPETVHSSINLSTRMADFGVPYAYYYYNRTLVGRVAHTGTRDKDRFSFLRSNGYLPQYAYSCRTNVNYQISLTNIKTTRKSDGYINQGRVLVLCYYENCPPEVNTSRVLSAVTRLTTSTAAKLNEKARTRYYSMFETLYEGRKTKKMILGHVISVCNALRDVRKGNFQRAAKTLGLKRPPKGVKQSNSLESNWLAYRYGWQPLYLTIYGEMKRKYDHMKGKSHVRSISCFETYECSPVIDNFVTDVVLDNLTGVSLGGYNLTIKRKLSSQVLVKRNAFFTVTNETLANSAEIGITNPAQVAWELVPLSFVVDWFVNVSDVLAQFDSWAGKQYLSGTLATFIRGKSDLYPTVVSAPDPAYYTSSFSAGFVSRESVTIDRQVVGSPSPVWPQFNVCLNPKRLTDAIALLAQRAK